MTQNLRFRRGDGISQQDRSNATSRARSDPERDAEALAYQTLQRKIKKQALF